MKKIYSTLLLAFIAAAFTNLSAQETAPGCGGTITSSDPIFIRYVEVRELDNTVLICDCLGENLGDNGGYEDFTAMSWSAVAGIEYKTMLRAELNINSGTNPNWWKMWIDLNKNGSFDDAGEEMISKDTSNWGYFNFTIPGGTADGNYTMRVAVSSGGVFGSACDVTVGEIQDYTMSIGALSTEEQAIANLEMYPNPVANKLNLSFGEDISSVTVYSVLGSVVYKNNSPSRRELSIDTKQWRSGLYLVNVRKDNRSQTLKVVKE